MIVATCETSNFSFIALGSDHAGAERAIFRVFAKHCRQYEINQTEFEKDWRDAIRYVDLQDGQGARDGEKIT